MRIFARLLQLLSVGLCAWLVDAGGATAEERVALVIGNGAYTAAQGLENPPNDARLMADALEGAGFDVTLLLDADQETLARAIRTFGSTLRSLGSNSTGLFFFAGHGVQSFGNNYLLPVDVNLTDAADLPLVGIEAQAILRQMFSARNQTNIVILDACRNNPFQTVPDIDDNGLAEMKAPTGTFLAYSTAPGAVALDGLGDNSPFTAALARNISVPGQPIELMFKSVRVDVLRATNGRQVPWDTSSLTSDFEFKPSPDYGATQWAAVRDSNDIAEIEAFLDARPGSPYEPEALALLERLRKPVEPAPQAPAAAPAESERVMIERARISGSRGDYQAYLDAYPQGVFAELATFEIAILDAAATAPAKTDDTVAAVVPEPPPKAPEIATAPDAPVEFLVPLGQGGEAVEGKTLEQLIAGSPLFPPIDGLPDSVWKGKNCSNCHTWKRDNLCTQAQTYAGLEAERSLAKKHPYGGGFKANLLRWAQNDCR